MNQDRTKRKLTAILSADVVGYSRMMEADEAWTIKSLEDNKSLFSGLISDYEGRVVDAPGDNILAEFTSVINAVECAVKIQQELKSKNSKLIEEHRMEFRIGINLGDVVEEDGRIYGNGVNIAARLEGLAEPGGICISRTAYDQIHTKLDLGYEYLGEHNVKNITVPVRVYRILTDSKSSGKVIGEKKYPGNIFSRKVFSAVIILIIIAAGITGWIIYSHKVQSKVPASVDTKQAHAISEEKEIPKTIAVLPFENLSPDKDQEYFADGIAEELLNSLTRISELEVRGRTSSFYFKGKNEDLHTISKMLNVNYILEGSVRKAGDQVRITVQLINTPRDAHIWSKTYEFKMDDIFAIQDDIAKSVADALQITLGVGELGRRPGMTKNPAAYEAYLVGAKSNFLVERNNIQRAIDQLEKAVALDPDFAICWSTLADFYGAAATLWNSNPEIVKELFKKRKSALSRVIEINPDTDLALGIAASLSGNIVEEERLYKKALALNPDETGMNGAYGTLHLNVGRPTEAIDYYQRIVRKEPLNSLGYLVLGFAYEFAGNIDKATVAIKKGKELATQPEIYDNSLYVLAMEENNQPVLDKYFASLKNSENKLNQVIHSLYVSTENAGAKLRSILADPSYRNFNLRVGFAVYSSYFEEDELALQAYRELDVSEWTTFYPIWRPIHKNMRRLPGFKDLVKKLGLVDYWQRSGNWGDFCHPVGDDDFVCE